MAVSSRILNAYESMLSTSIVVVGADLDGNITSTQLQQAWSRTSNCYDVTRSKLETKNGSIFVHVDNGTPPLQPGELDDDATLEQCVVKCGNELPPDGAVISARTVALPNGDTRVVFTLNHALSDGPGAWSILATFLEQLSSDAKIPAPQPLVDVQTELLKTKVPPDALTHDVDVSEEARASWLPIEGKQGIPKQVSDATMGTVDSVYRTIPMDTVSSLRDVCRKANASLQGALTAAAIVARLALLNANLPKTVPVLVPMNARPDTISPRSCACGSAGIWLVLDVASDTTIRSLASAVTTQLRAAMQRKSHIEWTRRIMEQPATLMPHAMIASSIGLVPVLHEYGDIKVRKTAFFGGRQPSEQARGAVGTMVHWATTQNESKFAFNFASPGVATEFATRNADGILRVMIEMISEDKTVVEMMECLARD